MVAKYTMTTYGIILFDISTRSINANKRIKSIIFLPHMLIDMYS